MDDRPYGRSSSLRSIGLSAEVDDLRRTRYPGRSCDSHLSIRFLESVLDQQMEVITLVEDLALDVRVMFAQEPHLAVFLGDQFLAHRGDLDVDVVLWQVEIWSEVFRWLTVIVPLQGERVRLVVPVDPVEVQQSRKFAFAVVSECGELSR
jgi:hypothetical protein